MKTAFLYARVSTGEQDDGMQLREMRELAGRRGYLIREFRDVGISGTKDKRPALDEMMQLVRRGKCDVVMVYRFDRFARSTHHLVTALVEFQARKVEFVSVHEAIDTTTPMGKFAFSIFAALSEFERDLISQRTRSGMALARARGKRIGRPRLNLDIPKIRHLRAIGRPWSDISRRLGVSESILKHRAKKELESSATAAPVSKDLQPPEN